MGSLFLPSISASIRAPPQQCHFGHQVPLWSSGKKPLGPTFSSYNAPYVTSVLSGSVLCLSCSSGGCSQEAERPPQAACNLGSSIWEKLERSSSRGPCLPCKLGELFQASIKPIILCSSSSPCCWGTGNPIAQASEAGRERQD